MRKIDYHIDIRGESCPYPLIHTLEALQNLQSQEVLEVVADCPQTLQSIPNDVPKYGYNVIEIFHLQEEIHFLIQKP